MSGFWTFLLLGLGSGGAYSLLALGIVLVYRGSGVVNFAQGAVGLFGVSIFYELRGSLGTLPAILLGVVAAALLGVAIQMCVMRPMRRASSLMRVVATLAVLSAVQEAAIIKFGNTPIYITGFLPSHLVRFSAGVVVGEDQLINLAITGALTAALWMIYRATRFGIATAALAENERATAAMGWSPSRLAIANWGAGGALAGVAGILLAPVTGLSPDAISLAVVPALAAGLVGSFSSFPLTFVGGLLIGVLESECTRYISAPGWSEAVPFLVIIVIMVVRGKPLPLRSHTFERLPRLGAGNVKLGFLLIGAGVVAVSLVAFSDNWAAAVSTAVVYGFVSLSLVVVVGFCGQLSLAQFAIAGVGALISTRLAATQGLSFPAAFVIGVLGTVVIGAVVALPALRVRGVNLAVVTLGLAVVVSDVVLANPSYTGGVIRGTVVKPPTIAGFSVYSVPHPQRYAALGVILFFVAGLMVANVRRGRTGRRMIAVRDNERAAVSLGVSVFTTKLYAFALAAGLAAAGGILFAYTNTNIVFDSFDVLSSINTLLIAVIGGIGYAGGAIFGGVANPGGPLQEIISSSGVSTGNWYLLIASLVTIGGLIVNVDGVAKRISDQWSALGGRLSKGGRPRRPWTIDESPAVQRVVSTTLEIEQMGVQFGGVTALRDVSLTLAPGRIVGLIGPNGAGKTTLIDAVTGFVAMSHGTVRLAGRSIDGARPTQRARLGVGRSFQSLELFEDLSVADNLRTACDPQDPRALVSDLFRPGKPVLDSAAAIAVREFELQDILHRSPADLPYAQRRLVAIARTVARRPSVLLLDEPASGLDAKSTRELSALIRKLARDWGMSILLIEHDVDMVLSTCDEVVVLDFGQVIATGTPEQVRHDPAVLKAYLGTTSDPPIAPGTPRSDDALERT